MMMTFPWKPFMLTEWHIIDSTLSIIHPSVSGFRLFQQRIKREHQGIIFSFFLMTTVLCGSSLHTLQVLSSSQNWISMMCTVNCKLDCEFEMPLSFLEVHLFFFHRYRGTVSSSCALQILQKMVANGRTRCSCCNSGW